MTINKYLKLKKNSNNWWYQRRVPKAIQHLVIDTDRIDASLRTADINIAIKQRDIINGRLASMALEPLTSPQKAIDIISGSTKEASSKREQFIELVSNMKKDKEQHPIEWDLPYDTDNADEVFLDAYRTVNGKRNFRFKYKITIKESLKEWVKEYQQRKKADHVSKVKKSVLSFLQYLEVDNIQLEEISKRQVKEYIDFLLQQYKKTTAQGYISRLKGLWKYSERLSDVKGICPFEGHEFYSEDEVNKKQPFTVDNINWIKENVAVNEPIKRLLVELGVFTGCRISELCRLRAKHFIFRDNVAAIFVEKSKNSSSTRLIPLTNSIGRQLISLAEDKAEDELLLGLDGKAMSRWFSRIKIANISEDPAICFHSFRVMFCTAMQQAEVGELKAAAIVGHKRGGTMTYGYYSKGYELQQLKEAYDQGIERLAWYRSELPIAPTQ